MPTRILWKAASSVAVLALLVACGAQGSEPAEGVRSGSVTSAPSTALSGESPSSTNVGGGTVSAQRLLDDLSRTLSKGPTHVVLLERANFPDLMLIDGVLDVPHHAAMYKQFEGMNGVDLTVGGVDYECVIYDRTHRYPRGYCDASSKWVQIPPEEGLDSVRLLVQHLEGPVTPAPSALASTLVRPLGHGTIRGVAVEGFVFEVTASTPRPAHEEFVLWLDENDMVREVKITATVFAPELSPLPRDSADGVVGTASITPDPELQQDQAELERTTPDGVATPSDVAGQATRITVAQFFDIGTAPPVTAPPPDAVVSLSAVTGSG